jgi:hypothetical protein
MISQRQAIAIQSSVCQTKPGDFFNRHNAAEFAPTPATMPLPQRTAPAFDKYHLKFKQVSALLRA